MKTERYWAVQIGNSRQNKVYLMLDPNIPMSCPMLFHFKGDCAPYLRGHERSVRKAVRVTLSWR
jgi:hypothetical protein